MHRLLLALSYGLLVSGCSCSDIKLEIVEPLDGTIFNAADDLDDEDGIQIRVLVATEDLSLDDGVELTVGETKYDSKVGVGGVAAFELVTLAEGENVLVARAEDAQSEPVIATADSTIAECPTISITAPSDGTTLNAGDDEDDEPCVEFHYTVRAATDAQSGRDAELFVNGSRVATATVEGAAVAFDGVVLNAGANELEVVLPSDGGDECRSAVTAVDVDCEGNCMIVEPTGDTLNADADIGDDPGLQVDFRVDTDIEDGQTVELSIDDGATTLSEDAAAGEALFSEVSLAEGERIVQATCTDAAGNEVRSAQIRFEVDTVPPEIEIARPEDDEVFGLSQDADADRDGLQIEVCAQSDTSGELCAALEGGDPGPDGCDVVDPGEEACLRVDCSGHVVLEATIADDAGNEASRTVTVTCDAGIPVVGVETPEDEAMLNATVDEDAAAGLQYTVTACSDAVGSTAELFLNDIERAEAEVVDAEGGCLAEGIADALPGRATFVAVTIPEGEVTVRAEVESEGGNRGVSASRTITVDSQPPNMTWTNLTCGATVLSPEDDGDGNALNGIQFDVNVRLSEIPPGAVVMTLSPEAGGSEDYQDDVIEFPGVASFPDVTFLQGVNVLEITVTDAVGNVGTASCAVEANIGGFVRIASPGGGQRYTAAGDGNPGAPGYQGVTVNVVSDGPTDGSMEVVVLADGIEIGRAAYANAGGQDVVVDLPEGAAVGDQVTLTAQTDGHPGDPLSSSGVAVLVDTLVPETPGTVTATTTDVRAGSIELSFTAPADPAGRTVTRYEVRRSPTAFAGEDDGSPVAGAGAPVDPGSEQTLTVTGMFPGASYFFAVRAVDAIGNVGSSASSSATPVSFTADAIESPSQVASFQFGVSAAGGADVNDDSFADVVVGTGPSQNRAYLFYGSETGLSSTPDVTFNGGAGSFGTKVAMLRDFDGDGFGDVAIGDNAVSGYAGAVYVFLGGDGVDSLPESVATADADVTISSSEASVYLGNGLSTAGDINDDGYSDLLVAADRYSSNTGEVFVVLGEASPTNVSLPLDRDLRITGVLAGYRLGAVAPAGNLDGDEYDDFIVATCRQAPSQYIGSVYVFHGESSASIAADPDRDANDADVVLTGGAADYLYGCGVGGVGDVNNDSYGDLVIGIPGLDGDVVDIGAFEIHLSDGVGGFDAPIRITNTTAGADALGDKLGYSVAWTLGLEDDPEPSVDGGDAPDIAVAAWEGGASSGTILLYPGGSAFAAGDMADAPARTTSPAGASYASPIGYAGDVDGDGFVDLFSSDFNVTVNDTAAVGRLYLFR